METALWSLEDHYCNWYVLSCGIERKPLRLTRAQYRERCECVVVESCREPSASLLEITPFFEEFSSLLVACWEDLPMATFLPRVHPPQLCTKIASLLCMGTQTFPTAMMQNGVPSSMLQGFFPDLFPSAHVPLGPLGKDPGMARNALVPRWRGEKGSSTSSLRPRVERAKGHFDRLNELVYLAVLLCWMTPKFLSVSCEVAHRPSSFVQHRPMLPSP